MKKEKEKNLVPKWAIWSVRVGGRGILREILGLRKKRGRPLVRRKEEGGELGRLKERFPTKRERPKDLVIITSLP